MKMENIKREVVMTALVGSHNYGLATQESDKDYKQFVLPTFEDLYTGTMYSKQVISDEADVDTHDVRKLIDLFYKANLNFLEPLFSVELHTKGKEMKEIHSLRNEIFNMNLPRLFNSCGGTFLQKMKLLPKGTEGTQLLVDKFGYDTKQAQHAYRNLNFIVRYAETDFTDVEHALRYEGEDLEFMQIIKSGEFSQENFERFVYFYHDSQFVHLKEKYHSRPVNEELKQHLESLVMKMVKKHLLGHH